LLFSIIFFLLDRLQSLSLEIKLFRLYGQSHFYGIVHGNCPTR
jgi:hypothetical protein